MKLNLGCRNKPLPGYINVDIDPNNKHADLIDDALVLSKVEDNSCELIEAVHMAEHLNQNDFIKALITWKKKLKDFGILRLSVPDATRCSALLLLTNDHSLVKCMFMGSQKDQWDHHKNIFTEESLYQNLSQVGFKDIRKWDYWDTFPHNYCDSYASAVWPSMHKKFKCDNGKIVDLGGTQLSLNIEATNKCQL